MRADRMTYDLWHPHIPTTDWVHEASFQMRLVSWNKGFTQGFSVRVLQQRIANREQRTLDIELDDVEEVGSEQEVWRSLYHDLESQA